jgi:carboxypeptidase Q
MRLSVLLLSSVLALACRPSTSTAPEPTPRASTSAVAPASAPMRDSAGDLAAVSDDPIIQEVVRLGRTDNRVHDHLRYLSETIGPRLTTSHALMKAEAWCTEQFASWGLQARLERWGELPVGFDRGPWSGKIVAPVEVALDFTTPAWTPGVLGPARGKVVAAPADVKAAKAMRDLAGAWVLDPPRGEDPRKSEDREKIAAILRAAKITGFIQRARGDKGLVHTSGRPKIAWDALPQDVEVILRGDQYDDLRKRVSGGEDVTVEMSIDNRFFRGPVPLHNVIADIPGTSKPDELVIVGGHSDTWDGAQGANDNGTGMATTMEAARLLMEAGARPERTIRFMLWSGEEQGLLGSRAYVEQHAELMPKVSAVLVHDGGTNYLSGIGVTPEMHAQATKVFAPVQKLDAKMPFEIVVVEALRPGGSDHSPFIGAGVPGFFWEQAGDADYDKVHHTQHDTIAESREDYQKHSAMVVAIAAYNLANLDMMLERKNSAPLARRRLGVDLDGMTIEGFEGDDSKAKAAGWKVGDKILTIDGKNIEGMGDLFRAVQQGEPKKKIELQRGRKKIVSTVDWSDVDGTAERERRRAERQAAGLPMPK